MDRWAIDRRVEQRIARLKRELAQAHGKKLVIERQIARLRKAIDINQEDLRT